MLGRVQGVRSENITDCHSQFAIWLRNDRNFYMECGAYRRRGVVTPPYGRKENLCKSG